MDRPLVAVVLAGGRGTRLYPATRPDRPKQFLAFGGDESLLSRTVQRVTFADATVVLTPPEFAEAITDHAPEAEVLIEPQALDTGPALVYAAHELRERYSDPVMLCLPSDHRVKGAFEPVASRAASVAAETEALVTIAVEPDRAATGYGYVVPGGPVGADGFSVERFVEKPTRRRAESLLAEGALWNAGMFAWTPEALLREARDSPLAPLVDELSDGDPASGFAAVEPMSIDRAVLERGDHLAGVAADFEWDDLGTWDAVGRAVDEPLADTLELDAAGNVLASDGAHITVIGASDLVVAAYDDRVLVVPTDQTQAVRRAVEALRERGQF